MCQGPPLVKAPARQQHNFRLDFLASRDRLARSPLPRLHLQDPPASRLPPRPSTLLSRNSRFRLESTRLGFGVAKPVEASLVSLNSVTSSQARLFSRKTRKVSGCVDSRSSCPETTFARSIDIFMLNIIHLADKGDIDVPKLDPFTRRERASIRFFSSGARSASTREGKR
ncbi:RHTO0S11e02410g1_1 [Rhodotorula toruloides]|uniref:RHTO0S11e02410g1_1 n=1 Tax=Rhodotorula toruloides TaxID=5286 RepID=A0A061B6Q7_RHOTO|nr:RHTO0S11e02410g1_1 [Rhodotorula toruloides]